MADIIKIYTSHLTVNDKHVHSIEDFNQEVSPHKNYAVLVYPSHFIIDTKSPAILPWITKKIMQIFGAKDRFLLNTKNQEHLFLFTWNPFMKKSFEWVKKLSLQTIQWPFINAFKTYHKDYDWVIYHQQDNAVVFNKNGPIIHLSFSPHDHLQDLFTQLSSHGYLPNNRVAFISNEENRFKEELKLEPNVSFFLEPSVKKTILPHFFNDLLNKGWFRANWVNFLWIITFMINVFVLSHYFYHESIYRFKTPVPIVTEKNFSKLMNFWQNHGKEKNIVSYEITPFHTRIHWKCSSRKGCLQLIKQLPPTSVSKMNDKQEWETIIYG